MNYILYKITNILSGTFYIGVHKTKNLEDGYMGSGKLIKRAIKKYGVKMFKKEILEYFKNEQDMLKKEAEVLTFKFILDNDVYNIMPGGGMGSKDKNGLTFKGKNHTLESKQKISQKNLGKKHSDETKKKMSENNFARRNPEKQREHAIKAAKLRKNIKGAILSEETKEKIKQSILKIVKAEDYVSQNKGLIREKIKCPHCNKYGSKNVMMRWHFNNCPMV